MFGEQKKPEPKPTYTVMRGDLGWAMIPPTRRFHFYIENRDNLCHTRREIGAPDEAFTPPTGTEIPQPDDCAACWKALHKRPTEPS